jgi:hypothetical protein
VSAGFYRWEPSGVILRQLGSFQIEGSRERHRERKDAPRCLCTQRLRRLRDLDRYLGDFVGYAWRLIDAGRIGAVSAWEVLLRSEELRVVNAGGS